MMILQKKMKKNMKKILIITRKRVQKSKNISLFESSFLLQYYKLQLNVRSLLSLYFTASPLHNNCVYAPVKGAVKRMHERRWLIEFDNGDDDTLMGYDSLLKYADSMEMLLTLLIMNNIYWPIQSVCHNNKQPIITNGVFAMADKYRLDRDLQGCELPSNTGHGAYKIYREQKKRLTI